MELEQRSEREQLLQFELHLTGHEAVYDVLLSKTKSGFSTAVDALMDHLQPVKQDALCSAELIKRRQQPAETVDQYAQEFEQLFMNSYDARGGMDLESKEMLKRDLFVQGLLLIWQKTVLPSANTFGDALHQARAAEKQEKQLAVLHSSNMSNKTSDVSSKKSGGASVVKKPAPSIERSAQGQAGSGDHSKPTNPGQPRFPEKCYRCNTWGHIAQDCRKNPPAEATGKGS